MSRPTMAASRLAVIMISLAFCSSLGAQDAEKGSTFEELEAALASETEAWKSKFDLKNSDIAPIARYEEWPLWHFIPKFVTLARTDAKQAIRVAEWLSETSDRVGIEDRRIYVAEETILRLVDSRGLNKNPIAKLLVSYQHRPSEPRERLLRACLRDAASKELRGVACLALGLHLRAKAQLGRVAAIDPENGLADLDKFQRHLRAQESRDYRSYVHAIDTARASTEAEQLIARAKSDFGDLSYPDHQVTFGAAPTIAEYVDSLTSGIPPVKKLSVGTPAPEIAENSLDGEPMRLSGFRGKIVVLIFWASWCEPCLKKVEPLRELRDNFADQPVAIVGINMDRSHDAASQSVRDNAIFWRSWRNKRGDGSTISDEFRVLAIPAVYVIDADGIIRSNDDSTALQIHPLIEKLLSEFDADTSADETEQGTRVK